MPPLSVRYDLQNPRAAKSNRNDGWAMKAINRTFVEIINGSKQFIIPVFQRDFSWTRDQWDQLLRDVLRASNVEAESAHFMGSVVYVGEDLRAGFQSWLLIDGQQRLTTLTLLLIALRDHIQESNWSGSDDGPTAERIDAYYLKNVHESGQRQFKLVLRRKDNDTLQALVSGDGSSEDHDKQSDSIVEAYEFYRTALRNPSYDPELILRGIACLNIVDVTLDRATDNPQLVFESMNSTGVDLRQSDLVRKYLLMGLDESEQTRLYDQYWSKIESYFRTSESSLDWFLRDFMALRQELTQTIRLDRVYAEFKLFRISDSAEPIEELLDEMVRYARRYASFLGIAPMKYPWLAEAMGQMRSLNTTQGLLVMRLYEFHHRNLLTPDEFIGAVRLIESYLMRRAILGLQTKAYWSVFARVGLQLNPDSVFESLQVAFARLRGNNRFPNDEDFKRGLREHDLYGLRVCKHILDRLENADFHEPSPVHSYSIEHIMPQAISDVAEWQEMLGPDWQEIHETYLHRLGNLTLTAYNSSYSNRPFEEKKSLKGGFRQSAVRLNLDVRDEPTWTTKQIIARGERLADLALQMWPHHKADAASVQAEEIRELKERATESNVSELKMGSKVRQLLDAIRKSIFDFVDVIEVIERRSVCCYGPEFFVELLPMQGSVRVILPLDFSEIEDYRELTVRDASTWKFVPHRVNTDCDLLVDVWRMDDVTDIAPIIRQALDQSRQ